MSFPEFVLGLVQLALAAGFAGFTAFRLRGRLLPGWAGAPARLVEAVAAIGLLVVGAELLGLFGLLHAAPLLLLLVAVALAAWFGLAPRQPGGRDSAPPSPPVGLAGQLVAVAAAFVVFAQWGAFTANNLDHGITNFDSVWYHMPFAAEIARSGNVTEFFKPDTVFLNWFYPQNSELLHAVGMVLTGRDFVSIFVNLGWLAIGLLAGWCVGRPYGRQHLTMLGVAVLMATHTLVVREPGTGKNDIMAIALVLSAVAIMLNRAASGPDPKGRVSPDWAMAAGGLAIGLAAGTKVTALAPALLVTCAVIIATVPGRRLRAAGAWLGAALAGGGWWYLRNLIEAGNPVPQITSIGPIELPGPERLQIGRPDFTVADYLGDGAVWRDYFVPGLEQGFGTVWPLLLAFVAAGLILVMVTGPGRLTRVHGAVALLAIGAYLITPLSAAGPEGEPTAFSINLRFLVPALGLAVVLIPLSSWFDRGWRRVGLGVVLVGLFIGTSASDPLVSLPGRWFGLALAVLMVGLPAAFWLGRERFSRRFGLPSLAVGFALSLAVLALVAWPLQKSYFENRYADFEPERGLSQAYSWASDVSDRRIALAGTTAGFRQFGFFGADLSNELTYIGRDAPHGGFEPIGTCEEFVEAVNRADPNILVTAPHLNFNDYDNPIRSPETDWVDVNPATEPIGEALPYDMTHGIYVWRVTGDLDPAACAELGPENDFIPGLKEP